MKTRLAVAVPQITKNVDGNLKKMLSMMDEASEAGAGILLFPEAVFTGLSIRDDFEADKKQAFGLKSPLIRTTLERAAKNSLWTAFGFLELSRKTIFDSALLIDNLGGIAIHQRRISTGWRASNANPTQYGSANQLSTTVTPWGKTAFLICGDMFEGGLPLAMDADLDLLLFPFARCFRKEVTEQQPEWDTREWPEYSERIKKIGALTLMSNYIAPRSLNGGGFGGGFIVNNNGKIINSKPLYEEGLLIADMNER